MSPFRRTSPTFENRREELRSRLCKRRCTHGIRYTSCDRSRKHIASTTSRSRGAPRPFLRRRRRARARFKPHLRGLRLYENLSLLTIGRRRVSHPARHDARIVAHVRSRPVVRRAIGPRPRPKCGPTSAEIAAHASRGPGSEPMIATIARLQPVTTRTSRSRDHPHRPGAAAENSPTARIPEQQRRDFGSSASRHEV